MNRIRVSRREGEDWYDGWIEVAVETPSFSGVTGFFGCPREFAEFAEKLSAYPIDASSPPEYKGGNVTLRLEPVDSMGHLRLWISIGEYFDKRDAMTVAIPVTYGGMQTLQHALRSFVEGRETGFDLGLH